MNDSAMKPRSRDVSCGRDDDAGRSLSTSKPSTHGADVETTGRRKEDRSSNALVIATQSDDEYGTLVSTV